VELGCEVALAGDRRLKLVMPASVTVRDLFQVAAHHRAAIRRLDCKRDSLQDIFLRAMEDIMAVVSAPGAPTPAHHAGPRPLPRGDPLRARRGVLLPDFTFYAPASCLAARALLIAHHNLGLSAAG
jgi:hypothetical protein